MRPLVYIMHIPKTAGMSLQGLVRRRHKKGGSLALIYDEQAIATGFNDSEALQTVMGHFRFGIHRFSSRQPRYFTFMREPVEQVISHYLYSLEKPEKFEYLPDGINNVVDFAHCAYGYNLQTRFISGMDDIAGREDEALHQARQNLIQHFEFVGITEEFDKSLLILGKHLNWKILYYLRENKGRLRDRKTAISQEEINELSTLLKLDIELYRDAQLLFRQHCDKYEDLDARLHYFRSANRWFQKLNPGYIKLKKILGMSTKDPHI